MKRRRRHRRRLPWPERGPATSAHHFEMALENLVLLSQLRVNMQRRSDRSWRQGELHLDKLATGIRCGRDHLIHAAIRHRELIAVLRHQADLLSGNSTVTARTSIHWLSQHDPP